VQGLQACLKEYFPQALEILTGNVSSRLACDFLIKWTNFEAFQQAKPATIKRFFYGHNVRSPEVIERVLNLPKTGKPLTSDPAILQSGARLSQMHAQVLQTLNPIIEQYEQQIQKVFEEHQEARYFQGLPGAGSALAPRLLVAFGSDRSRFEAAGNLQSFC